jgi:RimJ/RimL family protein N-acetyltransferase
MKRKLTSKLTKRCQSQRIHKTKKIVLGDISLQLVSMADLNKEQIKKLTEIYNKNRSMTVWTEEEIKKFVIDEKIQNRKLDIHRQYYSYCLFYNNVLAGYIIGKKNIHLLEHKYLASSKPNKFNILFTIGLDENYKNKGLGTQAIDLFIKMYQKKIALLGDYAKKARLYADIAADNIASIRAFEKNNFRYSHDIKISGKSYKRYSRLVFARS